MRGELEAVNIFYGDGNEIFLFKMGLFMVSGYAGRLLELNTQTEQIIRGEETQTARPIKNSVKWIKK